MDQNHAECGDGMNMARKLGHYRKCPVVKK
jgi:hypothetical protein